MKTIHSKNILAWIVVIFAILSFSNSNCLAQTNAPFASQNGHDPQSINIPPKIIPLPPVPNPDPLPPRFIPPRIIPPNPPPFPIDSQIAANNSTGRISNVDNNNIKNQTGVAIESGNDFQSNNLRIFPNPSAGTFTVNFHLDMQGDLYIRVIDVEGREIFSQNFNDFNGDYSNSFDLSDKGRGIYILSIEQNNKMMTRKVVID